MQIKKNTSGETKLTFIKEESQKVLTSLLARRYVNHLRPFVYKMMYRKSLGCERYIILFYPLISMYNEKYKRP